MIGKRRAAVSSPNNASSFLPHRYLSISCSGHTQNIHIHLLEQGDMVYFKNERMRDMDDAIGDIQAQITDRQVSHAKTLLVQIR